MREMTGQIEEALWVAELRCDDPARRRDARFHIALDHGSRRCHEIADSRFGLLFESAQGQQRLFFTPQLRQRDRHDVGRVFNPIRRQPPVISLKK